MFFFIPSSSFLLEILSGKLCFGFVVDSYVIIYRAGFHLLPESADSTMEFLQLCSPAWDVVFPSSPGNWFFGSAADGSCESVHFFHSSDVAPFSDLCSFRQLFFEILGSWLFCSSSLD